MAAELYPAIWNGPFAAHMPDGSTLAVGERANVTERDLLSSWWKPLGGKSKRGKKDAASGDQSGEPDAGSPADEQTEPNPDTPDPANEGSAE